MLEYANEKLLFKFLSLADDFDAGLESARKSQDYDALLKGVELIQSKLLKLFEESGVKRMESYVGKPFDVDFHEALMHIPSEFPEGNVIQEVQPGYMMHNKVLRHTKVVTSAGSSKE